MMKSFLVLAFLPLAVAGCGPTTPEVAMPYGHPANPETRAGRALGVPTALRPELTSVSPDVPPAGRSPASAEPTPAPGGHSGHSQ